MANPDIPMLYEAWRDPKDDSILIARAHNIRHGFSTGGLSEEAVRLYSFEAATHEEAMAIHNLRMGWAPYKPIGPPTACSACGSVRYGEGSGDCWRCDGAPTASVHVVMHAYEDTDGHEQIKFIGVFRSAEAAEAAVAKLSAQPGFCEHTDGFHVEEHHLDEAQWQEGFFRAS